MDSHYSDQQYNQFNHPLGHMNEGFPDQHQSFNFFDDYNLNAFGPNSQQSIGVTGFDPPGSCFLPNQPNQNPPIHQPQPQGRRIPTLAHLENEVQPPPQHAASSVTQSSTQDAQKKSNKNTRETKRSKAGAKEADSTRLLLDAFLSKDAVELLRSEAPDELMARKSLGQLRHFAESIGKGNLLGNDESYFLNFHDTVTKSLAINCLARGVKLSAVEAFLGHKKPFREVTRWHGFLQAPENRKLYRDCNLQLLTPVSFVGNGVKDGKANTAIKCRYDELTEEQKDAYKPKHKLEVVMDNIEASSTSSPDTNGGDAGQDSMVRSKSRSFASDSDKIVKWLREANIQLRQLCATYHLEGVIMVVSTHVSYGSVQLFRGTKGALKWHDTTKQLKPKDNCLANFHLFVLGKKVDKPTSDKSLARAELANTLAEFTNDKYKQWPWKNCIPTLQRWGYGVSILPGAASELGWITDLKGSNALTSLQARLILRDLAGDLIQLLRSESSNNPAEGNQSEHEN
ncbi:hypothetical protein DFH28DRAFT_1086859 [Melampsora americana]|nr:hypothetical protein DFH28DRAFT_1086859 [Melampsora americana]